VQSRWVGGSTALKKGFYPFKHLCKQFCEDAWRGDGLTEEIKKRVLRIILNSTVLVVLTVTLNITIPGALAIIRLIPQEGFSVTTAFMLLFIIVMAFQALRIILDLVRLVDAVADFLLKRIPGLKSGGKISVVKALKEIIIVIAIIIVTTTLLPLSLLTPDFPPQVTIAVSILSIALSIVLIYDAGKTLYAVLQASLEFFIETALGASGNAEEEASQPRRTPKKIKSESTAK
jgi:signal transduction histidine kinase